MKSPFAIRTLAGLITTLALAPLTLVPWSAHTQTTSQVYGGPVDRKIPTLFVRGEAGYTTYDSRMVDRNASAVTSRASFGAFAGESRNFGMTFTSTDTKMKFPLNDSKVRTSFRDLRAQARWGYVLPTFIASLTDVKASKEQTNVLDL